MKLCINPACSSHCDVVWDENFGYWRFANGFQMALSKSQMAHFDPKDEYNLCGSCEGMISLLVSLELLPEV